MNPRSWRGLAALVLVALALLRAEAAQFINGGFETGTLTGWIVNGVPTVSTDSALSGGYGVTFSGADGMVGQSFPLSGAPYYISFWLKVATPGQSAIHITGGGES
jgi:hypothetical protein